MSEKVPDRLQRLADLHRDRGSVYGDNYKHMGKILMGLFPRGLMLKTEEDFNRFHLLVHRISKESRYAMCMAAGSHHADSMDDLAVYAVMTREVDDECES